MKKEDSECFKDDNFIELSDSFRANNLEHKIPKI